MIKRLINLFSKRTKQSSHAFVGVNPNILGEKNIEVGDRFSGFACGVYFENQICNKIQDDGSITGTTTLAIFHLRNIIKYES